MSKRIVIVGGVAAGASAAAKARRTNEDVEIVLLETGPYISFANCGLPYYLGGEIASRDDLFVVSPQRFARRFAVDLRVETRATAIDRKRQTVTAVATAGDTEEIAYDRLVLATGTVAIEPPIPGLRRENIFTVRTVPDVDRITEFLHAAGAGAGRDEAGESPPHPHLHALVIGAGYIGLEAAEQLHRRGLKVTVAEIASQVMLAMDPEMALPLEQALTAKGCNVLLGDGVAEIVDEDGQAKSVAVTRSGRRIRFDVGILAVGVRPNVELAEAAGIKLGPTGAIAVDPLQRTSDPSVYAAGDNCEAPHLTLGKAVNIPLAGPANKAGRVAGANAALDLLGAGDDDRRRLRFDGVLGTAVVRVGSACAGVTGLTESQARREGVDHRVLYVPGSSHARYYPGAKPMLLKVLYESATGRLLGAQAVGTEGVDKRIDVLATAMAAGMTVEDLEQLDLCYAPPFGSAKDLEIMAGFVGSNASRGTSPSMTPGELLDELAGTDAPFLIDVRTEREFAEGRLDEAINIPVDTLRKRLEEVPSDRPVALYCLTGYRSYVAQQILVNHGRANVRNVLGGWTVIQPVQATRDS